MSVAEITARIGVGEKRMRVLIQDPRTGIRGSPAAFRIRPRRLSRSRSAHLNEALLVATSAMSGMNPGRPGGAGPAGTRPLSWGFRRRRRARPRSRTPGSSPGHSPGTRGSNRPRKDPRAYGGALVCRVESAAQDGEDLAFGQKAQDPPRPASAGRGLAPGSSPGSSPGEGLERFTGMGDERPENPPQRLEMLESAPGTGGVAAATAASGASAGPAPPNPGGFRFCNVGTTLNGGMAC